MIKNISKVTSLIILAATIQACSTIDKLSSVGEPPKMTPIQNVKAPPRQRSISLPMPEHEKTHSRPNSLWRTGAKAFFKDQRASRVGDILTVNIDISDKAAVANSTARSRSNNDDAELNNLLGFEQAIPYLLNKISKTAGSAFLPGSAIDTGSASSYSGEGTVDRSESIELTVAAIVKDVLPNGNLMIEGRQEVRVNFEKRILLIAGIVRPEDITAKNVIQHSQIAEARIIYGGEGQITDVQQPRYGAQIYDIVFPF